MKKLLSFVIVFSLCFAPFNGNTFTMVKTEALNIPIKTCYSSFSNKEQLQIDDFSSISNNSPLAKATYLNQIQDDELYEYCLKETLDIYYGDIETYSSELSEFKQTISSEANHIINNYEIAAEERVSAEQNGYSPTEVLVSLRPGTSAETIEAIGENLGDGYEVLFSDIFEPHEDIPESRKKYLERRIDHGAIISVDVDLDKTTSQTMEEIESIACVEDCSRNGIGISTATAADYSQEPYLNYQYYLDKINIGDAWNAIDISGVFQETIVAVLDSGLDVDHEDVVGNFLSSKSVDVTKTNNPKLIDLTTPYSSYHGTAVWGVIRARPKNKTGITGMHLPVSDSYSGMVKVMAVKMRDDTDKAYVSNYVDAFEYAVEAGAQVINISSGFTTDYPALQSIVQDVYDEGVTIVAAAGNYGTSANVYPACYDEVIGVASTDSNNQLSSFSSNNDKIDICAPGSNIYALKLNDTYGYVNGTSFSAPMVAGALALMETFHDVTPDEAKEALLATTTALTDTDALGHGLLNAGRAVEYARYLSIASEAPVIRSVVLSNSNKSKLRWYDVATNCEGYRIYRSTSSNGTYSAVATIKTEDLLWDYTNGCNYWYDNSSVSGQTYYYKVRAYVKYDTGNRYGKYSSAKSITIP